MTRKQRLTQILHHLAQNKKLSIGDLAGYFEISPISIRRDIEHLHRAGLLERVHGGVVSINESNFKYMNIDYRQTQNVFLKKFLGMKATEYVQDHSTIFLDNSTTVREMIPLLDKKIGLTVLTASLDVMERIGKLDNIRLIILEGTLDRHYRLFFSARPKADLKKHKIDAAFMGMSGINSEGTLEIDALTASLKRAAAEKASVVYIVGDHHKFSFNQGELAVPSSLITTIITDTSESGLPFHSEKIISYRVPILS